jgi:RNA polymerase sigma-70 factor (ECF subfamily)
VDGIVLAHIEQNRGGRMIVFLNMLETEDERTAFSAFYKEHKGKCLSVALAITHNHAWAEEAVQEAFLRMIRHKEKYFSDPCKRTGTTIVIMVKSAALNIKNRENKLDHFALEDVEFSLSNDEPDALRIVASKEAVNRLQYHISQLSAPDKALYQMKYILEKSDGEIAEILGISKNTAAVRIHRLMRKLLNTMREEGYIDG